MKKDGNTLMGIAVLITIIVIMIVTISLGCTESPNNLPANDSEDISTTDDAPNTDNAQYISGTAVVEDVEILILESFPVQVHAVAKGYLPDGCTEIDEKNIDIIHDGNTFDINVKTTRPADMLCTEAIVPFEQVIVLDVHGLKKGNYIVNINAIEASFELSTDNVIPE